MIIKIATYITEHIIYYMSPIFNANAIKRGKKNIFIENWYM